MSVFTVFQITGSFYALGDPAPGKIQSILGYGQTPLRFEVNSGQAESQVRYLSRGNGYAMYFAQNEVALILDGSTKESHIGRHLTSPSALSKGKQFGIVHLQFKGANTNALILADQTLPEKVNYLIGNEPTKWHTGISAFRRVHYFEIYPGIDLVFYGNQSHLEYDFVISPNASTKLIQLNLVGAETVKIESNGDLVFSTGGRINRFKKPTIYQTINGVCHDVGGRYSLKGNLVSFETGTYDHSLPLVIDPVLSYSTFLGGAKGDVGYGIAVDSGGNAYVCGTTSSTLTGLVTPGAFQTTYNGGTSFGGDAFVAKIDRTGTNLIYFTYLGGSKYDVADCVAVDSAGNAYLTGYTMSSDFPTSVNAIDRTLNGVTDAFVTKLNASGSNLIFSTYLGGASDDNADGIVLDALDNVYISGETASYNFPTTNAVQKHLTVTNGFFEVFVSKIASNGTSFVYSTFYGGKNGDYCQNISIDRSNYVYIIGGTSSTNFPVTNAVQPKYGGGDYDAFVFKLGAAGTNVVYSTYLGGRSLDYGYGIDVDANGNAYTRIL